MDFHDALCESGFVLRIVDWHRFACAFAKLGDYQGTLPFGPAGALEYLRLTGTILDGVEVKEEAET